MRTKKVYDLPLRLFHWCFVGLFVTAFFIAKQVDDESLTFTYHMMAGLTLGYLVCLRIVWGFVGSRHARFANFALHPKELIAYFFGILKGSKRKWAGHNPASSWAALLMMFLALGLAITGFKMTTGEKEAFEDIHEIFANSFLIVALLHVAGIALHTIMHRELIGLSMVDGKKTEADAAETISTSYRAVAVAFVILLFLYLGYLKANFDLNKRSLHIFGQTLQLGELEEESSDGSAAETN